MRIILYSNTRVKKISLPLEAVHAEFKIITIDLTKSILRRHIKSFFELYNSNKSFNPSIFLTDNLDIYGFICLVIAKYKKKPFIVRLRGDRIGEGYRKCKIYLSKRKFLAWLKEKILIAISKYVIKHSDGIIANSYYVKDKLRKHVDFPPELIKVVYIPCDIDKYKKIVFSKENNGITRLLTVTNLNFEGKYIALKKALSEIYNFLIEKDNTIFFIVGNGRFLSDLKEFVNKLPCRDKIKFLGFVKEIGPIYKSCDIFLYFSFQDAYPNTILEAQACKKPVITNYFGGMKEQVIEGKTGFFVDLEKKGELFGKLNILYDDSKLRVSIGEKAYKHVRKNNNFRKIGKDFINAIKEINKIRNSV